MKPSDSIKIVSSILKARRELVVPLKNNLLPGSGLSLEEADLLLDLYGAKELKWVDPPADAAGWVQFRELKKSSLHSEALISRRIAFLEAAELVQTKRARKVRASVKGDIVDGKHKAVRITPEGIRRIMPVFERYRGFSDMLLEGMASEDRDTFLRLNEWVVKKLRWR